MIIQNILQPDTIEDAYMALIEKRSNTVLGGCCYLRMGEKNIFTGIDLSKLNMDYIKEQNDYIEIGAMTTFRQIENDPLIKHNFNGILSESLKNIIGVQFRSIVTVGATVFSKYGFSDLITALMCLDTEVELFKGGRMKLKEFMDRPYEKDILTRIFIKKDNRKAVFKSFRNSYSDYAVINTAISMLDNKWIISVGARPSAAKIAEAASMELNIPVLTEEQIEKAASIALDELNFGGNMRATKEYRLSICKTLIIRSVKEVLQWN